MKENRKKYKETPFEVPSSSPCEFPSRHERFSHSFDVEMLQQAPLQQWQPWMMKVQQKNAENGEERDGDGGMDVWWCKMMVVDGEDDDFGSCNLPFSMNPPSPTSKWRNPSREMGFGAEMCVCCLFFRDLLRF